MNDREWDRKLRIRTIGREDESDPNCSPYEPTPYSVLQRLADSGHIRRRDHLLDYGCGKGRVAFFMAQTIGCAVTGVDYAQKLIDLARENRKSCRAGDRVRLITAQAEQYEPGEENVCFFFNPFSEKVFGAVLRRLARLPHPCLVICYYPSEAWLRCLEEDPAFSPVDEIDCGDLFSGRDAREKIVKWEKE